MTSDVFIYHSAMDALADINKSTSMFSIYVQGVHDKIESKKNP